MNNNQYQNPTPNSEISSKAQFDFQQKLNDYRDNFGEPNEETEAKLFAQAVELQLLKSPASAKFGALEQTGVTKLTNGAYLIAGFVDSQNSYGAVVRTNFSLTVFNDGAGWKCADQFVPTGTASSGGGVRAFGIFLMLVSGAMDIVSMFFIGGDYEIFHVLLIIGSISFFIGLILTLVGKN